MAMFVHLAAEDQLSRIRRNGIRLGAKRRYGDMPRAVYAMPVTRFFYVSHQWLRELKGAHAGSTMAGVYFRIPDKETVWVGHYGQAHQRMSAAEAVGLFAASEQREGWEVLIPRRIDAGEIHRTRVLPQIIGWRYSPSAKGTRPCACDFCSKGEYNSKRLRARLNP